MTTRRSRDLLDAIRAYAEQKLAAEGATLDAGNLNVPFNNDTRVQAALDWVLTREAEVVAGWTPAMDAVWVDVQDEVWAELTAAIAAAGVTDRWLDAWSDTDSTARILIKAMTRTLSRLVCYHRNGGV